MNRRDFLRRSLALGAAGAAAAHAGFPVGWTAAPDGKQKRILFFTRSQGFQHSSITRKDGKLSHAETLLTEWGTKHGFAVDCTKDGSVFTAEGIAKYDAFAFYTTGDLTAGKNGEAPPMSKEGKALLLDAVKAGKGWIGFHSASDTFHSPVDRFENAATPEKVDPYIGMIGGEFIKHGRQQKAKMICVDPKFPGLAKHADGFEMNEEWYSLKQFAADLHVILVQETKGMVDFDYDRPPYPATWAREHGKGRVFYTSMGHREDVWTNPIFQDVTLGAISWILGHVQADITPNIATVTPRAVELPKKPAPMPKKDAKKAEAKPAEKK